jgi:hypothetical protein
MAAVTEARNDVAIATFVLARSSCCLPSARSRLTVRISPVAAPHSQILETMLKSAIATRKTPAPSLPSCVVTIASSRKLPPP